MPSISLLFHPYSQASFLFLLLLFLLSLVWVCNSMHLSTPSFPILHFLPEFPQTHAHWVSNAIQLSHPVSPPSPPVFPSIRVFLNDSFLLMRGAKDWSLSFSINPSNEYSGLISFRINWFEVLAVQGTLKSLLQHYNLKASILWHPAFFMGQHSFIHDYWKNHTFDYMDLCWQSDVFRFLIYCLCWS